MVVGTAQLDTGSGVSVLPSLLEGNQAVVEEDAAELGAEAGDAVGHSCGLHCLPFSI